MKKKSIKQQVKDTEKIILEKDKDFFNDFLEKNYPDKKQLKNDSKEKRRFKPILITAGAVLSTILTVILLVIFLTPSNDLLSKKYLLENEKSAASDLYELNSDLQGITLELNSSYEIKIYRKYDSLSNDALYYTATLTNDFKIININVYVNKDYEHQMQLAKESTTTQIGGFTVNYYEIVEQDDILFNFTCAASIKHNDIVVYIDYKEMSLEEASNFFSFIEQTVKKV